MHPLEKFGRAIVEQSYTKKVMHLKEPAAIISVYSILNDQMMLNEITADTLSFFSWIKSGMNGRQ